MNRPSFSEVIVVEGRYDAHAVRAAVDATVVEVGGFSLFASAERQRYLRALAEKRGLIVLTDSDGAGMLIRNKLKSFIPPELIKQAYIPQVKGKERRKQKPGKAGLLGVEGLDGEVIARTLLAAGGSPRAEQPLLTRADLFDAGLFGSQDSARLRRELCLSLGLPDNLSTSALLDALNALGLSAEDF